MRRDIRGDKMKARFRVCVRVKDMNFNPVEQLEYSGDMAVLDAIKHLAFKYCNPLEIVKHLW